MLTVAKQIRNSKSTLCTFYSVFLSEVATRSSSLTGTRGLKWRFQRSSGNAGMSTRRYKNCRSFEPKPKEDKRLKGQQPWQPWECNPCTPQQNAKQWPTPLSPPFPSPPPSNLTSSYSQKCEKTLRSVGPGQGNEYLARWTGLSLRGVQWCGFGVGRC